MKQSIIDKLGLKLIEDYKNQNSLLSGVTYYKYDFMWYCTDGKIDGSINPNKDITFFTSFKYEGRTHLAKCVFTEEMIEDLENANYFIDN